MRGPRSVLFASATRPDHVAKMARSAPDVAVIDLEDGVSDGAKEEGRRLAREGAARLLAEPGAPALFVRINGLDRGMLAADLGGLVPGLTGVVLPMVEDPAQVRRLRRSLDEAGLPGLEILAGLETAAGVDRATEIAAAGVCGLYFGAEDYITDIGGRRTAEGTEVLFARSKVVLAARRAGIPAIDMVVIDPHDDDRLEREAVEAVNLGFTGKLCIHPRQVPLVHAALRPTAAELEAAEAILRAAEAAERSGQGVSVVGGAMIDRPAILRARAVLARAGEGAPSPADGPGRASPRAVSGRYLEDLHPGDVIHHAVTRTVTEADNTLFSSMTMNPQPLHLDADFSAAGEFGERLVNSMLTLALTVGLSVYELTLGTTVANLGFTLVEFPHPLFHGDTLRVETEVLAARPSVSRPEAGVVEFEHRASNQRGELVARCRRTALMKRKPGG